MKPCSILPTFLPYTVIMTMMRMALVTPMIVVLMMIMQTTARNVMAISFRHERCFI